MTAEKCGRHLTTFEMMAHHAFTTPNEVISGKDRTVEIHDQFIASISNDNRKVTCREKPWIVTNARKARGCRGSGFERGDGWYTEQLK